MKKHKGLYIFILTIITLAFIVFVAFMQHNFMNPEFSASRTDQVVNNTSSSESNETVEEETTANKEEDSKEEEDETPTISTKVVNIDLLNVRGEPTVDSVIVGGVTLNQELEVEDINNPDGWVKVSTDNFTGYIKDKFLDEME